MIVIQSHETIKKTAQLFSYPLVIAAFYTSYGVILVDHLFDSTIQAPIKYISFWMFFFVQVLIIAHGMVKLEKFAAYISCTLYEDFEVLVGIILISISLIPISYLFDAEKFGQAKILWNLSCFFWGYKFIAQKNDRSDPSPVSNND